MVRLYQLLTGRGGTDNVDTAVELSPDGIQGNVIGIIEGRHRYLRHAKIDRSSNATGKAKAAHGICAKVADLISKRIYG